MLKLEFGRTERGELRLLCLGAHSDDIEIGCGGTLLRLLDECDPVSVNWVVFSSSKGRRAEAERSAHLFLEKARRKEVVVKNFRESFFPYRAEKIKEYFECLKQKIRPDIIFTHYRNDIHQDHRTISELTWNTFRDHLIFEFEIMKYDGDIGNPNYYVHLDQATCEKKTAGLLECFRSQSNRHWFTRDAFLAVLRLRGIESNAPEGYAEGFYCRKMVYGCFKR